MKYTAPIVEIEVLVCEDVVMISEVSVEAEGSLTQIQWGDLT